MGSRGSSANAFGVEPKPYSISGVSGLGVRVFGFGCIVCGALGVAGRDLRVCCLGLRV